MLQCAVLAFALLIALLTSVPASAQGPLSLLITVPVGSSAHDVALGEGFAYVATDAGLTVLDLTTAEAPVPRGTVDAGDRCQNVELAGSRAFLACTTRLVVVDVTDPDTPRVLGTRAVPYAWDVALKGNVAYVSSMAGELYVLDVTGATPLPLKTIGLPAWKSPGPDAQSLKRLNAGVTAGSAKATGVSVSGDHLFTVDWGYGRLFYFDISVAERPVFAGTHYAPYILKAVADVERDTVYLLGAYSRLSGIYTVPLSSLAPDRAPYHAACAECRFIQSAKPSVGIDQGGLFLAPGGAHLVYGGGRGNGEFHVVATPLAAPMRDEAVVEIGPHGVPMPQIMNGESHGELIYYAAGTLGVHVYRFPGL